MPRPTLTGGSRRCAVRLARDPPRLRQLDGGGFAFDTVTDAARRDTMATEARDSIRVAAP